MRFFDMVVGEEGLLVELRAKDTFNERMFENITGYLNEQLNSWKAGGAIPVADAVALFHLIDALAGGSRFWSEDVALRVEDAVLELQDLINALEE